MAMLDALMSFLPGDPKARAKCAEAMLGAPLNATCRHRSLLYAALVFAGLATVGGIATLARVAAGSQNAAIGIVLAAICLGASALVVVVSRKRQKEFVGVYEQGVAIDTGSGVRTIRWEEVRTFHSATNDTYRLELHDGSLFTWNQTFERHREVGVTCASKLDEYTATRQRSIPGEMA